MWATLNYIQSQTEINSDTIEHFASSCLSKQVYYVQADTKR